MLDNLLARESKWEDLSISSKPSHFDTQAINVKILKTNISSIAAAELKDMVKRGDSFSVQDWDTVLKSDKNEIA